MNHRLSYFRKFARPAIAIAIAYALVLQVLLLSVIAAGSAMAVAADGSVICYGGKVANENEPQPAHSPAGFAQCTLACAQGLNAAAILPDGISSLPAATTGHPLGPTLATVFVLSPHASPRLSQGPPQIA
jgi:hypothetical protein